MGMLRYWRVSSHLRALFGCVVPVRGIGVFVAVGYGLRD